MNFAKTIVSTLAAATLFGAQPALADAITLDPGMIGQSYTIAFDGYSGGTTVDGLTSTATFKLTGTTGTSYTFDYVLTNSTSSPLTSRVSSFAFNTDPNIASANSTGAFSYTTLNSSYPNGIGAIDVCFKDAATGSCSGGGSGGLATGATGTGSLTLNFSQPITSLTLSDFYVRYQSITGAGSISSASGSGTLTGSSGGTTTTTSGGTTSTSSGGTAVPEPGMLGLLGGAVAALALVRRRRRIAA